MNAIMQQLINNKVNSLTTKELLDLASQNNINLSFTQAKKVISILRSEKIDIANKTQVERMIQRLQTEVDPYVSSVIQQLLHQFNQYL
jgi:ribosomal protein L22